MSREAHVPFCEGLLGKFQWSTLLSMNEDACRIRQRNSTENLATVRHTSLNLLKNEKSFTGGMKRKHKQANRSDIYREKVVSGLSLF